MRTLYAFDPLRTAILLLGGDKIQEMGHIELLAERVQSVKGDVEMTSGGPVEKIVEPEAILVKAMAMEEEGIQTYNKAVLECAANADSASNIKRFGLSYLALQSYGGTTPGSVSTPSE